MTRHAVGARDEFVNEAALSRARLRGDQRDVRSTRLRLAQQALEPRQLALPADEPRKAMRPRAVEAAADPARTAQLEHADGDADALQRVFATVEEVEEPRHEARRLLGEGDATRWRQLLDAGGEPDDVALRGVVHAQVVADAPDDDLAGVQTHSHRQLEPALASDVVGERAELAGQIEGGRTGALRVVLVGDRGAEERHDAIAGVLIDGALVSVNAVRQDPEQAIEQAMPFFGIEAFRQLHRAHDVGEQDGDQLALAAERALRGEDLLDEMPRRVGARLAADRRRCELRAATVAEPRASGVVVSTERADHAALM